MSVTLSPYKKNSIIWLNLLDYQTCLDGTQNKVRIRNYLSSSFPIENGLKQGDTLSPLLFNFDLEYVTRKVQETNLGLDMNGTQQVRMM